MSKVAQLGEKLRRPIYTMDRIAVSLDKYLVMYSCWWIVLEITTEESDGGEFQWERVRCKWSYLGPMPNWHKDEHVFLVNRRRVRWWFGKQKSRRRHAKV